MRRKLKPIPFGERPGSEPYNASEVLALDDSRFLFCDNNVSDALFEFRLGREGELEGQTRETTDRGPGARRDRRHRRHRDREGRRPHVHLRHVVALPEDAEGSSSEKEARQGGRVARVDCPDRGRRQRPAAGRRHSRLSSVAHRAGSMAAPRIEARSPMTAASTSKPSAGIRGRRRCSLACARP